MATVEKITEFSCPECGEKFSRAASLGAHRARKHGYRSERKAGSETVNVGNGWEKRKAAKKPTPRKPSKAHEPMKLELMTSILDNRSYSEKLMEFLPSLSSEIQRRQQNGSAGQTGPLVEAFFALYNDAH